MIPDKIFCDDKDDNEWGIWFNEPAGWNDVAFIRKDTLVGWINEARAIPHENAIARDLAFQEMINHINEM